MIYLHENGVTVVAKDEAKRGKVYEFNGEKYYIARGVADIKRIVDSGEYPLNRVITSKLTSLNCLFQIQGGYSQAAVPENFNDDITNWDTSNVLSMEEVFSGWPEFNQDISNWDTSKVEQMSGMFKSSKYQGSYYMGPTSFNQDISNWDVSNVKNMSEMFLGATSFNQNISNWDVSNVKNMDYMFSGATSFNQPIGDWDTSKVEYMRGMFSDVVAIGILAFVGTFEYNRAGSTSFNQDISNWDVSNVKNMDHMFSGATSFNQDISNWDVSNVENMDHMFSAGRIDALKHTIDNNPTSFNQPLGNWDVSNVVNMSGMFSGAISFNQDISNWDVSNVEYMDYMFSGATSFNQDLNGWGKLVGVEGMFYGATSFNSPIGKCKLYGMSMENMFREATAFNQDISCWDVSNVENMSEMFLGATSFNQDISNWDVSNVTQMKGLFQEATSFNQNIRNWKLNEKLPKSRTMFKDAKAFNIKEYNPFLNKIAKERKVDTSTAGLSTDDKKTFSKIKKLLTERDYDKIDLGLELLISLNNLELFETLLFDCKIEKFKYSWGDVEDKIVRNKLFTGSEPAQPFLDYALINIMANAPNDAKIDNSLQVNKMSSFDIKLFKLETMNSPLPLDKFTSLNTLIFNFDLFNIKGAHYGSKGGYNYNEGDNGVNIEDFFNENNITHLKAENVKGSFKWMKNFKQLKSLEFDTCSGYNIEDIESFKYLENLEELKLSSSNFLNLDFLTECKNLKKLDLSVSYSSSSYSSEDKKLENINFLNKLNSLEDLKLSGLNAYEFENFDFSGLYSCKQIKQLSIDVSKSTDLSELNKCISLESLELRADNYGQELDVSANISEVNGLKELKSLKSISTGTLSFYGLDNGNLMTDSNSAIIVEKSTRVNEKDVALVDNIRRYQGLPFNGTICKEINEDLFFEYEVVDGFKDGVYREFYLPTGNIKLEILFEKNKINKVVGFYDQNGKNILEKETCISAFDLDSEEVHRIGGEEGGFIYKGSRFTGFCLLDVTIERSFYGRNNHEQIIDLIKNLKTSNINSDNHTDDKVSLLLKLKNGIITKDILVATKEKYTKTSVVNDYDFDNMPSSFDEETKEAFKKMDKEKHYRLYVYMNSLFDIPVMLEDQNQPMISDKNLDGKSVVISGVFENYSRNELKELIELKGGKSSSSITKNTSFVLAGDKMGPSKKQKANDLNIEMIGEKEFAEKYVYNQNDNQTSSSAELNQILLRNVLNPNPEKSKFDYVANNTKRPKLTSDDRKSFSEIKKLLSTRDFDKIDEAVQKLVSLNILELFETLLDGCEITVEKTNWGYSKNLIKNKIFTGSSPAQPYLNYALFSVIAHTPEGAEIHDSISKNNIIDLDFSVFDLSALEDKFIPIEKFSSLSSLKLDFKIFEEYNKGAKNINRENWFANNNISKLDVNVSGSLQWMKNFAHLKYLNFKFDYYPVNHIESFEFLENVEELSLKNFNYQQVFKNLDFLKKSKKIKKFSLDIQKSYDATEKLENIDIIKDFTELTDLEITGIYSELSLDFLLSCKKIKNLKLKMDNSKNDTNYFELLKNCSSLETLKIEGIDSYNIKGKVLNINGLNGLPNLKNFSLNKVNISTSDNSIFLN